MTMGKQVSIIVEMQRMLRMLTKLLKFVFSIDSDGEKSSQHLPTDMHFE